MHIVPPPPRFPPPSQSRRPTAQIKVFVRQWHEENKEENIQASRDYLPYATSHIKL